MTQSLRLSANLGFLWQQLPLLERIEQAAQAGFRGIELHGPYDTSAHDVARLCKDLNLTLLSINTPQGDTTAGDSGLAAQPGREAEFRQAFQMALAWARESGATLIHVLPGQRSDDMRSATDCLVRNLRWASDLSEAYGVTLLLEAINERDKPGYFYHQQEESDAVRQACDRSNIKLMFDVYHVSVAQGDILNRLTHFLPHIGHIQIAGVPARNEPDRGEVRYEAVFKHLTTLGYDGWIGCEYRPENDVTDGLMRWTEACGLSLNPSR